ncbi:MAG TPA: thio(seleno)oxazole modification radical SAM maturase SbtM [Syntrophales bacterium]|nr:thio(seleno)oxazole modification radical SAM maturase SbtM [Syntrophales bacterium]
MSPPSLPPLEWIYPVCRVLLGARRWARILPQCREPSFLSTLLEDYGKSRGVPPFIADLARLEWAVHEVEETELPSRSSLDMLIANPALRLVPLKWKNLTVWMNDDRAAWDTVKRGNEIVLAWKSASGGAVTSRKATTEDLLVLKMTIEGISPEVAADKGNLPVGAVDQAILRAVEQGILLSPPSRIRRDPAVFGTRVPEEYLASPVFTLQWHITQACDLSCRHCYDRSRRSPLKMPTALRVLDELRQFCRKRFVSGQVTFTGGNPLLYPKFLELYRAAVERGFAVVILGNPAPRPMLEKIVAIRKPAAFQVSLEGLESHNDLIRGKGQFRRVLEFLSVLRDLGIYSMVMLTLTRDNLSEVLPLAEFLRDRADSFTFNRLSRAGEGAALALPDQGEYIRFLAEYLEAEKGNPILGLKDNLMNIFRRGSADGLFGGCTGYGCGAAFNFLTLLPDGEIHACRKFPSFIGNIREMSLEELYDSPSAARYREGSKACRSCPIRAVCGGCLASTYSFGRDVFTCRDPYCFIDACP